MSTAPTPADVHAFLDGKATPAQRPDCDALITLMSRLSGEPPVMWGPSMVGFGRYRYRYESGRTGESFLVGFAVRGKELVLYLSTDAEDRAALLERLGPHRSGTACLYLKRLADAEPAVLERLIAGSIAATRARHPQSGA